MDIELYEPYSCPILINSLNPSEETISEMKKVLKYQEKEYLESDDNKTCYVGDSECFDKLHTFTEFQWLNQQVENMLSEFISVYGIDKDKCNFYIQKSWPVFLKDGDSGVDGHTHPNSHISFVYYLQSEEDNQNGQLHFTRRLDFWNGTVPFENSSISFITVENNCLMFPSSMTHWVSEYFGDLTRISITYDITITSKNIPGISDIEMMISDPTFWRKIDGETLST
jgi:uncharacterized protein (TIGR02466 family)